MSEDAGAMAWVVLAACTVRYFPTSPRDGCEIFARSPDGEEL